ncbi:MAG: hydantoinase B/oxoprolinase family protein, partial [Acidobacteria bacterium]|nr:hydantoinase B/oxoprolinase family protein [Acidobacteriota bacterium]
YGLDGGMPGKTGRNTLISGGISRRLGSKFNLNVLPGDVLRIETPGGGGYGRKK